MIFDWTISLGNMLTAGSFFVAAIIFALTMKGDIRLLAQRIKEVESDLGKIANVIIEIARQEERLSASDRRSNDLANRVFALEQDDRHGSRHNK